MLLSIRDTFVLTLICVCMCSVCWLLLVKLSILAKWFARKTALRKPNRGEGIVSTKLRLKSVYDFLGLLCCFIVWLCHVFVFSPALCDIFRTPLTRYSLFVLKVPLNTNQLTNWWILSPAESGFYSFCDPCKWLLAASNMSMDLALPPQDFFCEPWRDPADDREAAFGSELRVGPLSTVSMQTRNIFHTRLWPLQALRFLVDAVAAVQGLKRGTARNSKTYHLSWRLVMTGAKIFACLAPVKMAYSDARHWYSVHTA